MAGRDFAMILGMASGRCEKFSIKKSQLRRTVCLAARRMLASLPLIFLLPSLSSAAAPGSSPSFRAVAIGEGGIHKPFVDAAKVWLQKFSAAHNFTVDYIENSDPINEAFLARYQLFLQLNYAPYAWKPAAMAAFVKYIDEGKGGWIGFHHATLLGEFDGYQMWPWFSQFMGGIRFTNYIAKFATATVTVEDPSSPYMKNVPKTFIVKNEEWYTYNKSPRPNVKVLASVDENTYSPDRDIKMGDHPVVWTNPHYKAKNIYIFMGHHPDLFQNEAFTTLFKNSILWAAKK